MRSRRRRDYLAHCCGARELPLLRLPSSATGGGRTIQAKERFARRLPPPTRTRTSLSSSGRKGFDSVKPRCSNLSCHKKSTLLGAFFVAEKERFELSNPVKGYTISNRARSTSYATSPNCWCGRRDLNPYGKTTRPSNVRVCQFRHFRIKQPFHYTKLFFVCQYFFCFFYIFFCRYCINLRIVLQFYKHLLLLFLKGLKLCHPLHHQKSS